MPRTSLAEFAFLKSDRTKSCSIQLFEARNIPHQCQVTTDGSSPLEVWQNRLSFHFGKLSQPDFIFLKNTYSGWSQSPTHVTYDRHKSYQLVDFLPTLIQAVNEHRFIPEATTLKNQDGYLKELVSSDFKKYLYMNCWGIIYEILRTANNPQAKPTIFMGQASVMLKQIRNNSNHIFTLKEPSEFPIQGALSKPGDVILIMHRSSMGYEYLDHMVMVIDDGVYFEKAGTGADVPIRLIDEATLLQIWQPGVFRYELRRLHHHALLSHPQEVFSLDSPFVKEQFSTTFKDTFLSQGGVPSTIAEIPLNLRKNITILWDIDEESRGSISWFYLIDIPPLFLEQTGKAKLAPKLYQPILFRQEK